MSDITITNIHILNAIVKKCNGQRSIIKTFERNPKISKNEIRNIKVIYGRK